MMRLWWLAALLVFQVGCADASSPAVEKGDASATVESIQLKLEQAFAGIPIDEVSASSIPGWWSVRVGSDFLEVSPDGRYVMSGALFDLSSGTAVNVSEKRGEALRAKELSAVPLSEQIVFKAKQEKYKVYVFTDHTCGFCRTLHEQVKGYNDLGISIHYLGFPRGGPDVASAEMLDQVWCASDRQAALTEAKATGRLARVSPSCDSPVRRHYELGRELGIRGTPAIFTTSGESIPGYRSPADLLVLLKGE